MVKQGGAGGGAPLRFRTIFEKPITLRKKLRMILTVLLCILSPPNGFIIIRPKFVLFKTKEEVTMKRYSLLCVVLCILALFSVPAHSDTYVSGPVIGTWTTALSPYVVLGPIEVPVGQSLTIQPGVVVLFAGQFRFTVHGMLTALGTPSDSIRFTHQQPFPTSTWADIFFETASPPSVLSYCAIEYGYAQGAVGSTQAKGGGIHILGCSVDVNHCRISNCKADVKGGGIYLNLASGTISNNLISNNTCVSDGGGIFADNTTNVFLHDNEIKNNSAVNGGGLQINYSSVVLTANQVHHNSASNNGGGFSLDHSSPTIQNSLINSNTSSSSYGTGIYCTGYSSPQILYNEICFNNYTAIYCGDNSSPAISNCTIFGNNSYVIRTATYSNPIGTNNIMLGSPYTFYIGTGCSVNMSYSDIQIYWPGTGNLNNAAPYFVNSYSGDFHLMPFSPCIDHGNPSTPLDPDGTIADMGAHYFDHNQPQGICNVTVTPLGAPIVLPPQGGTVWFTVLIQNSPNYWNLFDAWLTLQQPDAQIIPLLNRTNLYLPAGGNLARTLSIFMNSTAMPGTYTLHAYVGTFPNNIEDQDQFTFVKSADAGDNLGSEPATATITDGDLTQTVTLSTTQLPHETKLLGNYPDPFNPTTDIRFQIPDARQVSLQVYDTAGRLVSTLVDGYRDAGDHQVTFDGSQLASGLYFLRMQAGDYTSVKKMTLLK
jgi:parallel beta-helix repeat protein